MAEYLINIRSRPTLAVYSGFNPNHHAGKNAAQLRISELTL